jgi:hypothetical protein
MFFGVLVFWCFVFRLLLFSFPLFYMDMDMDDLDLSWANEYIRSLDGGMTYQPEFMTQVSVHCLYIDNHNELVHRKEHKLPLCVCQNESVLREEELMKIVHRHQVWNHQKFVCQGMMKFHVAMDPQTILENVQDDNFSFSSEQCCHHYDAMPRDMTFPPSLFIFHSVNSMYLFFRQLTLVRHNKRVLTRKKRRHREE